MKIVGFGRSQFFFYNFATFNFAKRVSTQFYREMDGGFVKKTFGSIGRKMTKL